MSRKPDQTMVHHAKVGVKDMPRNAAWVLSKILRPIGSAPGAASDAVSTTADAAGAVASKGRRFAHQAASAAHLDGRNGEGVDDLVEHAREAADAADEAEATAVVRAQDAKQAAEEARLGAEQGEARLAAARADGAQAVEARIADAEREGAERVSRAQREASTHVEEAEAEERERVDDELTELSSDLQHEAEQRRSRADETATAAQEAIDEAAAAVARARDLTDQAQRAADEAAARATRTAERLRGGDPTVDLSRVAVPGADLSERTKAQLLDLAAQAEVENRTTMTKAQLVEALDQRLHPA